MNNSVFVIPFVKLIENYFYNKNTIFHKNINKPGNNYVFYGFPNRGNKLKNYPSKGFPKEVKRIEYPLYFRR